MKQQQGLPTMKKLSRQEMKNVQGGIWQWDWSYGGIWVCRADGYSCYFYQWECENECSNPSSCAIYSYCP